jgi:hypothetical protein
MILKSVEGGEKYYPPNAIKDLSDYTGSNVIVTTART